MINPEDLQLGDFVRVPSLVNEVEKDEGIRTVVRLEYNELDVNSLKELFFQEIEPIPITAEILESIGFKYYANDYCYKLEKEVYSDFFECYVESSVITLNGSKTGPWGICDVRGDICYVHELQHLLRYSKVNKTIF